MEIEIKPTVAQTSQVPPPLSFREINQQAYNLFKEQKVTANVQKIQTNTDFGSGITSERIKL